MKMIRNFDRISDLIRNGQIRLGMTRDELETILGKPDVLGNTSRKYRFPSLWKYGDVEFVFPPARNRDESAEQTLLYVYVDDGIEGVDEPIFMLGPQKSGSSRKRTEE